MVEGHSVHRICSLHRLKLLGLCFRAVSPNNRFVEGAAAINGKPLMRIEAVGKQLFYFFGGGAEEAHPVVVNVHFGMSGVFALYDKASAPATKPTTRLLLEHAEEGLSAHLSAMTVTHGGLELFEARAGALGQDPLRTDADPEKLWPKVSVSKKSIGLLLMDQGFFPGVGNIYRCEILFAAKIHPTILGKLLTRAQFDAVWHHAVRLLRIGFKTGSILTVGPEEAAVLQQQRHRDAHFAEGINSSSSSSSGGGGGGTSGSKNDGGEFLGGGAASQVREFLSAAAGRDVAAVGYTGGATSDKKARGVSAFLRLAA